MESSLSSSEAKAKGPLKDEERRLRLSEGMSQMRLLRPVDRLPELLQSQARNRVRNFEGEILTKARVRSKDDSVKEANFDIDEAPITVNADVSPPLKPVKERKERWRINNNDDSSLSEVVRELESTGNFKLPLDEKHIRSVLKKNKKLMKALVETYKLKTTTAIPLLSTTNSEDTLDASNTTKDITDEDGTASALPDLLEFTTTGEELLEVGELNTTTNTSNFSPKSTTESINLTTSKDPSFRRTTFTEAFVATTSNSTTLEPRPSSEDFLPVNLTENPLHNTLTLEAEITLDYGDISRSEGSAREVEDEANESSTFTTSTSTTTSDTSTTTTTTVTPPYWPKKGYVPNTRKHASEITSKLYLTHEIVQALSAEPVRRSPTLRLDCLENRRCCKITRSECSDGSVPKYIKRYYRPRGSDVCVPYHYPRCSQGEEMEEQPIQYEQNCQDLCFKGPDKHISPLLTLADN
ncbi:unnamed protein product [Cylicocyclus nassatus]|uniref:Uncharacterized protein n=1 Tax=Cylicocyclus nassatus TaxID=53992 RepID=A0AA36HGM8_CYLNA|nr:unnamed protein product [Cylicocyclus nassatus]